MQKLLSTAAVLVALAVPARAECPLDYTAVGPFCVAGENSPRVRAALCRNLAWLGVILNE
jgi:hypothetical protein